MKIFKETLENIYIFQEGSMSIKKIEESIVWLNDLKKRAEEGEQEAIVDYVKYKRDGLPKRFFDKWAFSYEKMKNFLKEHKLKLTEMNFPDEPLYFILRHDGENTSNEGFKGFEKISQNIQTLYLKN
jgi:hypothetical protein